MLLHINTEYKMANTCLGTLQKLLETLEIPIQNSFNGFFNEIQVNNQIALFKIKHFNTMLLKDTLIRYLQE